jgi:hypothetical protein
MEGIISTHCVRNTWRHGFHKRCRGQELSVIKLVGAVVDFAEIWASVTGLGCASYGN